MTERDALERLIAAVKVGGLTELHFIDAARDVGGAVYAWRRTAYEAHDGSLDAAKALHEALLPGKRVQTFYQANDGTWCITLVDRDTNYNAVSAISDNPARAWLLAILRALASMQEGDK